MSINFFIVRHAIKEKATGDVPITPIGVRQAESTAQHLRTIPIAAVVSSPLRRAVETAQIIAEETNTTLRVDGRLRERANWGDLPGQSFQEFVEMWERCTREQDYNPPVGDTPKHACERMSSLLAELVNEYPAGSNIAIVTHGGLITDYLVNSFPENVLNTFHTDFISEQSRLVSECSITKLTYDNKGFAISIFASTEHIL